MNKGGVLAESPHVRFFGNFFQLCRQAHYHLLPEDEGETKRKTVQLEANYVNVCVCPL